MAFEIPENLMVSVSGVRGRVGEALTPEVVSRFAAAFGAFLRETSDRPRVLIARDSRTSGPMFVRAATAALQSVGCDLVDLGLVPTPTALYSTRHHEADGVLIVTASHNPVEWNALKLASGNGMFLDADEAPRMREYLADRAIPRAGWDEIGGVAADEAALDRHLQAILDIPLLDIDALRERRFTVALDCIRGAGAVLLPRLLEELGCDVRGINLDPDGLFPREPEPTGANLADLEDLVRETGADIGLATDPDADRLSIVSERGRAIGEDWTLALAADVVLRHRKGAVATNLSTSRVLDDVAADAGVELHRAPVGEINVARRMQETDAVIGGEGNGGVIFPDVQYTRDSAVAAALVLQFLLEAGEPVGEYVAGRPAYTIVKEKLPWGDAELEPVYRALSERFDASEADRQDGLRLAWPEEGMWVHVRPSGTEPVLRIIAEAPSEDRAREVVEEVRRVLAETTAS